MKFLFVEKWNNMMLAWLDDPLSVRPASIVNKFSPESHFLKIPLIAKDLAADFLRIFKKDNIPNSKVWFFVLTQNNLNALTDIKDRIPNSEFVSFFRFRSTINNPNTYYFNLSLRFFWNFMYPFYLLVYSFFNRVKAKRYYELLITVNGTYEECIRLLKKTKPKAIVFSNDHLIIARALLLAANKLNIKTYYVQHAAIGDYFPPLEFTYSMLEGEDSLLKYKNVGEIKSDIHLCGMPKFDPYIKSVNNNKTVENIGIAFNMLDPVEAVLNFSLKIKHHFSSIEIILRPHPGDERNMNLLNEFTFSDSNSENSFEFLSKIDCLISGESSIHLEATLMNVYPLHFCFTKPLLYDIYGFLKNNMLDHFDNVKDVVNKLEELIVNKPTIQKKAKFYNAALGSDFYGDSVGKISSIIRKSIDE